MQNANKQTNTGETFSPNSYYREVHPEFFSDTVVHYETPLTSELFDYKMSILSTKKMQSDFESFIVAVAKRLITPNIKPQTGPDGGGDGKVDAETYEVSDDISDKWIATEETALGKEYWAFAISCKKEWKSKVTSDIEKIVNTNRGYTKALFFTSQFVKSSTRAETEEKLSERFGIKVEIYDANWLSDAVFNNGCLQIALDTLAFSDEYKRKTISIGAKDKLRKERLDKIENSILRHIEGLNTEYIDELLETCILSRALERPKTEVEARFKRAIRECNAHGSKQQMYNIVYEHAWTSFFWYEDIEAVRCDYNTLKSFLEELCNVTRIEKFTNILNNIVNSVKAGMISEDFIKSEINYIYNLEKKLKKDSNHNSSLLYLQIYIHEQYIIEHVDDKEELNNAIKEIKPLLIESASHLEISIEAHYKIIKMLSSFVGENKDLEILIDEIADIIAERRSKAEAARVRLERAEDHMNGKRWLAAVKQLGFCVYAFEQESCMTELIRSSGYMGIALNSLGLYYSAEAFLVKSASLLLQDFFHSGRVDHLLVTILQKLCSIELKIGRIVMYFNWFELLMVISQNSQYNKEPSFMESCHLDDAAWACRLAISNCYESSIAKLPDIFERLGMYTSSEFLKYALGYPEDVDDKCLPVIKEIYESAELHEQPVFEQFYDKLNISTVGVAYAKTTVRNFTITVTYENSPQTQHVVEIFLASIESFMATFEILDFVVVDEQISVKLAFTDKSTEVVYIEENNKYELYINREEFDDKQFWECFVKFILSLLCQNAVSRTSIESMIETRQHGERLMDRVSVLLHSTDAFNNILGKTYKYRLEDWIKDSDKVYPLKRVDANLENVVLGNKIQSTVTSYKINSNMNLWKNAEWTGCAFIQDENRCRPAILGLAFRNLDKGKVLVREWNSAIKVKIYIVKGIDANHPSWYRVCIAPDITSRNASKKRFITTFCKKHIMTPSSTRNLNCFEEQYRKFGGCWLMACHINETNTIDMPTSFDNAFKFTGVEFWDAYKISNVDNARMAIEPDDRPFIPKASKSDAPILNVLAALKEIVRSKNA